ncbi:MAG: hypothetical protein IT376_06990 [Polyangiaceae bacterium]|nr:hypothetical protein [Polyangiaceae bacterium]
MSAATDRAAAARVERRERIAIGGLVLAWVTPSTYAAQRVLEVALGEAGSPAMVLRAVHTMYYWRAGVALWWGITAAVLAAAWLERRPQHLAPAGRWLGYLLPLTAAIVLIVSFALP